MFDHQQHIFPHENIALPGWCWLLLLVAGIFSSGCYPPVGTGDRTQPTDAASDQPTGRPWAATDGEALPAVAVTDADGRLVEPVIQLGHHVPLQTFQFSPDGQWLLTSGRDSQVIQWNAETGDLVRSFATSSTEHVEITPDGRSLLLMLRQEPLTVPGSSIDSGQASAIPSLISLDTGRVLHPVRELPDGASVRSATLTTDGRYLLRTDTTAGFRPRHRWLWDVQDERFVCSQAESAPSVASDEPLPEQPEESQRPFHFERSIRPDGQILVTQSPTGFSYTLDGLRAIVRDYIDTGSAWDDTRLWDIASGELLATLAELDVERRPFHFSPNEKRFLRGSAAIAPKSARRLPARWFCSSRPIRRASRRWPTRRTGTRS